MVYCRVLYPALSPKLLADFYFMTIQEKIYDFVKRTKSIIEANPGISNIDWAIRDVPYPEFDLFRRYYNSTLTNESEAMYLKENPVGDKMYMRIMGYFLNADCDVSIYSVPVKVTTVHQVEELNK